MLNSIYAKLILGYFTLLLIIILGVSSIRSIGGQGNDGNGNAEFTEISSPQDLCTGGNLVADDSGPTGPNPYFILTPGHQIVLERENQKEDVRVVIEVLNQTEIIDGITTRVVRETETADDVLTEISRNFFVRCDTNNNVFYLGEDVDIYEDGEIVAHDGAWRAGEDNAEAGLIMPGTILLGSRFYQEIAPDIAQDRAEVIELNQSLFTPCEDFEEGVLVMRETTPVEPNALDFKYYAPGVGLVKDDFLELTCDD